MRNLLNDESGFIVSAELVLVATIAVIGLIVGWSEVQAAVVHELNDVANAIGCLNQTFAFRGFHGCKSVTVGSQFLDTQDACDSACVGTPDLCLCGAPQSEADSHALVVPNGTGG